MTPAEQRLMAVLLDLAADRFANHGCNDFDLSEIMPDRAERDALVAAVYGDDEVGQAAEPDWRLGDDTLMREMARRLRAEVGEIDAQDLDPWGQPLDGSA